MTEPRDDEEIPLRSVALQNAQSILLARLRAEEELARAKDALERKSNELASAVDALRQQAELWRVTLSSIGDAVITTDIEGRVLFLNSVAQQLTGWAQEDAQGRPFAEVFRVIHKHTREPVENPADRALREGVGAGLADHTILIAKDGTETPIDDSAAPIRDDAGQVYGVALVFRDVTGRNQDELARARLAAIVDSSDDAIIGKTMDGIIVSWNAAAEVLYGYSAAEAIGRHITMLIPPDQQDEEVLIMERLRRGERIQHFETVRVSKEGHRVDVSLAISPIFDRGGSLIGASKIARDITDRKRADAELAAAHAQLRAGDRAKNEFLATLGHELRNPLAPIRNALYVLQQVGSLSNEGAWATGIIDRQMNQLTRLVDDLLDLGRITSNKLELRMKPLDLAEVVRAAVEASRPWMDVRGHTLDVAITHSPISLEGDAARLAQVVSNLLNNAAKYTDPGGRVQVTVTRESGVAVITVQDTGVGIPEEMVAAIFEMFTQVDRSLDRADGGLGIGLTLVKRIVEMHRGTIAVHSDGPGKGSAFSVRLPITNDAHEAS